MIPGWQSGFARNMVAGGEVDVNGLGMQGGSNNMQYQVSGYWLTFEFPEVVYCDVGYDLIYNGPYNNIYDWGYSTPRNCASPRPG